MFAGILNSGPTNSIILQVSGVFTASLKGLFRSASPISFPVTTVRTLVRSSTSLKLRHIGDTLPRPLYSFTIDLRADRYPSICSLAEGAVLMRGVSTFSIGSPPEVDPPVLSVIPAGVAPMVSSGVPLRYSYSGGTRDLRVPEIYETNVLASSWGSPKTKLRRIYTRSRNSVGTLFLHCARTSEHGESEWPGVVPGDDLVNENNDSEVKEWWGNKSLYEQWKENHGEDPYDDDDFDDPRLTCAQIKFANAFGINLHGQLR
ncbi:hypothetical protein Tco_1005346 [Tanacetum coccineum]|uniref:Uncharacterized protein n=1 Tax=Tanacetum coccineum TaxID=301880 RepID=A0ABQ5FEZ6_9ASTR